MKVGSLFSGIGGLDLGLERAGMSVRWQSEVDPYCSRVLAKHWPTIPNLGDITKVEWEHVERVDLVCGGFPCQPFSVAGAQRGRDDPRHLWPHFADALRVLRPRYALLENVPGLLTLGFGEVAADLAELGYDFEWDCIPAAAVGAPHLRYRVFVVAYANGDGEPGDPVDAFPRSGVMVPDTGRGELRQQSGWGNGEGRPGTPYARVDGPPRLVADPEGIAERTGLREGGQGCFGGRRLGDLCGEGHAWTVEPDVGRVAHGVPARMERLRGLGNAVVPQVAEWVGRQLIAQIAE